MKHLLPLLLFVLSGVVQGQVSQEDRDALQLARERATELAAGEKEGEEGEDESRAAWRGAVAERIRILEALISTVQDREGLPTDAGLAERKSEADHGLESMASTPLPTSLVLEEPEQAEQYDQEADAAQATQLKAQTALEAFDAEARDWDSELRDLPERGEEVRDRAAALEGQDELAVYRKASSEYEQRLLAERTTFLSEALAVRGARKSVLELELELATARSERAEGLLEIANRAAEALRKAQSEATRQVAKAEARSAELEQDPIERLRLEIRSETSTLQAEATAYPTHATRLEQRLEREQESLEHLESSRESLDKRLQVRPQGVEQLLLRNLERTKRSRSLLGKVTLPQVYGEMEEVQDQLALILDRRWELSLPPEENGVLQELFEKVGPEREDEARQAFGAILREEDVLATIKIRENQLGEADKSYGELADVMSRRSDLLGELEDFVLGKMMWTRNAAPISGETFIGAFQDLAAIPVPYQEAGNWSRIGARLLYRSPFLLAMLGVLAASEFIRRRLPAWTRAAPVEEGRAKSILHGTTALVLAILPAGALWFIAWTVRSVGELPGFDPPLATLLELQAIFVLIRRLAITLIGFNGLCVGEYGMDPEVGMQIVRSVRTITLTGQLLFAPYRVLSAPPFEFEHLPRFLYTVWILSAGFAGLSLLRARGALVRKWTPKGTIGHGIARTIGYLGGIALMPLVALDASGYRIGAERSLLNGLRLLIAFFVLLGLFRYLEGLGEKIADWSIRRARDEEEAARRDLRANAVRVISRLSGALVVIMAAIGLQQMWGIGDPGRTLLSSIPIPGVPLTLWEVYVAILYIVVGHLLSHNLRRISDLLITPITGTGDVGSRYAAFTLVRYALLSAAYMGGLLNIGFSFETIGLFATAASVGLGFGLQEIVANFISGLILLFERPIRVGDIVTIGNTSGTVDEISMRATVVTNWERQTLIIPNKKFVTENLTNWTRNDRVMRRDLTVTVSMDTSIEDVLPLLDEVVGGHPKVLDDPPHRIWFEAFGSRGAELKVLFFTQIEDGLLTRSQLHSAIHSRLAEAGVELPVLRGELELASDGSPS